MTEQTTNNYLRDLPDGALFYSHRRHPSLWWCSHTLEDGSVVALNLTESRREAVLHPSISVWAIDSHHVPMVDLTLRCPTCGKRADMCFNHGDDWKKRRPRPVRCCDCGAQIRDEPTAAGIVRCLDCATPSSLCEQGCGDRATVYAIDPAPGGWSGRYCEGCAAALRFTITDRLS